MGHRLGIENIRGYLVIILPVVMAEHVLILFFTCSQHNQLDIVLAQFIQNTLN